MGDSEDTNQSVEINDNHWHPKGDTSREEQPMLKRTKVGSQRLQPEAASAHHDHNGTAYSLK